MKRFLIAGAATLAFAGGATAAAAGEAAPTVEVGLGKTVTVRGAEALKAGPTRFEFSLSDGREQYGLLFALAPGKTAADLLAAARSKGVETLLRQETVAAGALVNATDDERVLTVTLKPGVTYAVMQVTADNPSKWVSSTFTVAQETSDAAAPKPDATVRLVDYGFKGSSRLPQDGAVRFANRGKEPHFVVAIPLRKSADPKAAVRAVKRNQERKAGSMMAGEPSEPQALISGGAVNDTEVHFAKPGKYLLACFFSEGQHRKPHSARGMVRAVTVR